MGYGQLDMIDMISQWFIVYLNRQNTPCNFYGGNDDQPALKYLEPHGSIHWAPVNSMGSMINSGLTETKRVKSPLNIHRVANSDIGLCQRLVKQVPPMCYQGVWNPKTVWNGLQLIFLLITSIWIISNINSLVPTVSFNLVRVVVQLASELRSSWEMILYTGEYSIIFSGT